MKNRFSVNERQRIPFLDEPGLPTGITRFWLVRHALVAPAFREIMYGNGEVPLCSETLKEQESIYKALVDSLPRPAYWVSSPLKRARHTAQVLLDKGKFGAVLEEDSRLGEQSLGTWNGLSYEDFCLKREQESSDLWALSATECPPQGESLEDVLKRVGASLEDWAYKNAGQETVMISHGGAIRMALAYVLGISAEAALRFTIQNLSVTVIEHIAGQWRVVRVNTLSHFGDGSL
ncbi:histidine phosphatase family protein [Acetobacteraceae bacterium ESL0709]|nr:histidine phosphatase family protein [Acetobacteraceae bacterium ESL0709]